MGIEKLQTPDPGHRLQILCAGDGSIQQIALNRYVRDFCWGVDGQLLFVATADRFQVTLGDGFRSKNTRVACYSLRLKRTLWDVAMPENANPRQIVLSPDGKTLAVQTNVDGVYLLSSKNGAFLRRLAENDEDNSYFFMPALAFSPDSRFLVSQSQKHLRLWRIKS